MNKEKVSILSIFVNLLLGGGKFFAGLVLNSAALMADGIHSCLDIFSSLFAFLGIRVAKKPGTEKYPYGFYSAESLGGLAVTLLLAVSGGWIVYEGITRIVFREVAEFSFWGIGVIVVSIIVTELMARLKFKYGRKEESLALLADGEHSRADALSSVGVLIGLIAVKYFFYADGIIAILVGFYILKESYGLGREAADNLMGVKDERAEKEIREICRKENIHISGLKTRKIGSATFAEITIKLNPELKVEEAQAISKNLEEELLRKISNLKYIVIQVESHEFKSGFVRPRWGKRYRFRGRWQGGGGFFGAEFFPKKGYRIIIPLKDGEVHDDFGAPEYMVVDKENGEIVQKRVVKNPQYQPGAGAGMRMAKSLEADEVMTRKIGWGAKERAKELGIKITIVSPDKKLADILK